MQDISKDDIIVTIVITFAVITFLPYFIDAIALFLLSL